MFYAKLKQGVLIKKLIDGIKDLVSEINLQIFPKYINLQAMDNSHTTLIAFNLWSQGFEEYKCDKQIILGISIDNLVKTLRCGGNEDSLTLSCEEEQSELKIKFENTGKK